MNTEVADIEMLERAILGEVRDESRTNQSRGKGKGEAIRKARPGTGGAGKQSHPGHGQAGSRAPAQSGGCNRPNEEPVPCNWHIANNCLIASSKRSKEKLADVQKRPDYDQIAAMLLREALVQLQSQ